MRRLSLVAVAVLACSGNEPDSAPDASVLGIWQVTTIDGQALPALTPSSDTFVGGYLSLPIAPVGGVEYCATTNSGARAYFNDLRWLVNGNRVIITYRNLPGAAQPIDTATVDGESMSWRMRAAGPALGTSVWGLQRILTDPDAEAPNACP